MIKLPRKNDEADEEPYILLLILLHYRVFIDLLRDSEILPLCLRV